jgi:hypothetical protein
MQWLEGRMTLCGLMKKKKLGVLAVNNVRQKMGNMKTVRLRQKIAMVKGAKLVKLKAGDFNKET